jgi:hypothetical protein
MPAVLVVLFFSTVAAAIGMARALGRIEVLEEAAVVAEGVTEAALEGQDEAIGAMNEAFEAAEEERVVAVAEIAEAHAETIVQQAEAEAAFRRAENLAADNPILERAIQEMRAEAIVTEMALEAEVVTTASALLTAQLRIGTLEGLNTQKDEEIARVNAAWRAEVSIKDQIISEYRNVVAPSFLRKIFDMPEVAAAGVVLGAGLCLAFCPSN